MPWRTEFHADFGESDEHPTPTDTPAPVLLVDDDERNLLAARAAFDSQEYQLALARSGGEALRMLLEHDFAVILLDVRMPDMDGFETARMIRSRPRTRHTPIIFVTAFGHDDAEVLEGYALGAVDFLFKPIVPEVLRAKASVFVELHRHARRLHLLERRAQDRRLGLERQRWEAESLRLENQRKDEFLAVLAHELRNPLTPIALSIRILHGRMVDDPALDKCLQAMERQVRHLTRLVDDLLDMGRITSGQIALQVREVTLSEIVDQAIEATAPGLEARRHTLDLHRPDEPIRLLADHDRLVQVVSNLLSNAGRYTEPGGRIWVRYGRDDEEVWVEVRDDGRGIEPRVLPQIFQAFYRERGASGGLGLGLALVKKLVELHDGSVHAHSDGLGRGSRFVVRLPILPSGAHGSESPLPNGRRVSYAARTSDLPGDSEARARAASDLHILLVDDDPDVRLVTAQALRDRGHVVTEAADGATAVRAAESGVRFDVVLMDLAMPGMDGYQTAEQLRERLGARTPPIVALSGHGSPSDVRRTVAAEFAAHAIKPMDAETLLGVLATVLPPERPADVEAK